MLLAVLLLLAAGGWLLVALTGDGWVAVVVAVVALRGSKVASGRGRMAAAVAALLALGPLLLWGLWGLYS